MANLNERPDWATWFYEFGKQVGNNSIVPAGEKSPRFVVSSPTGQFTAWMMAAGALSIEPGTAWSDSITPGPRFATWHSFLKRMADATFAIDGKGNTASFESAPGNMVSVDIHPARLLPDKTPNERGGAPPKYDLANRLRHIPELENSWYLWWARHCISPVVIIGDGREYLQNQRQELLQKAPEWFDEKARALLSEDSGQTSNPERMYFHPFMVFSPESGNNRPWLRAMKPRLVIVTSWTAYLRRHSSLFAGTPHVIITNRRVPSSLDAASQLQFDQDAHSTGHTPPSGIYVQQFDEHVVPDTGELIEDDEGEWEL